MNALEVHESDLDDIRESDGDHPNTEEQTESLQDPVGNEPELMDLMDLYSVIDEEGEDDELIGYLGAMHPIELETVSGSDDEIVYCRMMDATCGDLPQLLSADSRRTRLPEDVIGDHNDQGLTWREPYGAVHQAECEDCTHYSTHLKEALGNEVPSTIAAVNYPSAMVRREFNRGWDAYECTSVGNIGDLGPPVALPLPRCANAPPARVVRPPDSPYLFPPAVLDAPPGLKWGRTF